MSNSGRIKVLLKMKCKDCGHIQIVTGFKYDGDGDVYFGSAYDWCNECDYGLPVPIEDLKEIK
jgi:hypothetical protein